MILFQYFYLIFCVYLSLNDDIENHTRTMHFIKAYLQHQDLTNKKEVKFYISFEMLRDKITKKIFSFLDLFGLNLWWVKKFDPFSGVTILLSLTVFHNIVTEKLPQVSDAMPLLGIIRIILFIETKSFCVCPYFIPSAEWKQTSVHNNASTWKSFHPSSNKKCNFSNWVYWLHVWQVRFSK